MQVLGSKVGVGVGFRGGLIAAAQGVVAAGSIGKHTTIQIHLCQMRETVSSTSTAAVCEPPRRQPDSVWVEGFAIEVWGWGIRGRVQGCGFKVLGLGFSLPTPLERPYAWLQGLGMRDRIKSVGLSDAGLRIRVWGIGSSV